VESLVSADDALRRLEFQVNATTDCGGDAYQGIERKARHAPAQQIIHSRLSDARTLSGFGLRPSVLFHNGSDLLHELRTRTEICRLLRRVVSVLRSQENLGRGSERATCRLRQSSPGLILLGHGIDRDGLS
jgi:hypothetical protein